MIDQAKQFATECHEGQRCKYIDEPYIAHPERVVENYYKYSSYKTLSDKHFHRNAVCAAWLHDVVEDCNVHINEIYNMFPVSVGVFVEGLTHVFTKEAFPDLNRTERKRRENIRLSYMCDDIKLLKMCDRLDNVIGVGAGPEDFAELYKKETLDLLAHICVNDVLAEQIKKCC